MAKKQQVTVRYAVLHLPTMETVTSPTSKGWVTTYYLTQSEAIDFIDRCCNEQSPRSNYTVIMLKD